MLTVFPERSSRNTVSFEEQIISEDKYTSILSGKMEATVFITLQLALQRAAEMFTSILLFVIVWSDRPVESSSKENCELLSVVVTDVSTTFTRSCTFYMK